MDISNTNRCGNHVHARRHILKIKKLVTLNITCNFIQIPLQMCMCPVHTAKPIIRYPYILILPLSSDSANEHFHF